MGLPTLGDEGLCPCSKQSPVAHAGYMPPLAIARRTVSTGGATLGLTDLHEPRALQSSDSL